MLNKLESKFEPRAMIKGRQSLESILPLYTPIVVIVDPSSLCNFKCKFCPTGDSSLIKSTGRYQGLLDFNIYKKCIDDLSEFKQNINMLKLYKDGEPLLNPNLAKMISYAKSKSYIKSIMVTTNGSLLSQNVSLSLIKSGIDKIHISLEGMSSKTYKDFSGFNINFDKFTENIKYLYSIRENCEISVKVPSENLLEGEEELFHKTFKNICNSYYIENISPVWSNFDISNLIKSNKSVYQTEIKKLDVCPYIFYQMSINSDGTISACCVDWKHELIVGNVNEESLYNIWNGKFYNNLRIKNLKKQRNLISSCKNCGQITHAAMDNIDEYSEDILKRMKINE